MFRLHIQHHADPGLLGLLARICTLLEKYGEKIMAHLDEITAEVDGIATVGQSVLTLVERLADEIEHHKDDPAALADLSTRLRTTKDALAAAVVAHTPAETPTEAPPAE